MLYLIHSAKGSTWKKHKYIRKEGDRYIYTEKEPLQDKKKKSTLNKVKVTPTNMKTKDIAKKTISSVANAPKPPMAIAKKGVFAVKKTVTDKSGQRALKTGKEIPKAESSKPIYLKVSGKTYKEAPSKSIKTRSITNRRKRSTASKDKSRFNAITRGTNIYTERTYRKRADKSEKSMSDIDYKKKRKRSRKSVTHDKTRPLSHK